MCPVGQDRDRCRVVRGATSRCSLHGRTDAGRAGGTASARIDLHAVRGPLLARASALQNPTLLFVLPPAIRGEPLRFVDVEDLDQYKDDETADRVKQGGWRTLAGLTLNAVFGLWWADPVAALVIVLFLAREGIEALRSEGD